MLSFLLCPSIPLGLSEPNTLRSNGLLLIFRKLNASRQGFGGDRQSCKSNSALSPFGSTKYDVRRREFIKRQFQTSVTRLMHLRVSTGCWANGKVRQDSHAFGSMSFIIITHGHSHLIYTIPSASLDSQGHVNVHSPWLKVLWRRALRFRYIDLSAFVVPASDGSWSYPNLISAAIFS